MAVANRSKSNLPGGLLANRNFILLWCAYAVSAMGDHLSEMAILRSQDALSEEVDVTPIFARMTFVFFIPFFVLGPIAGLLADRAPRRTLMVAADVARFSILLGFGAMIGWASRFDPQWGPVAPILLVGLFAAMFSPARSALLPTLIRPQQLVRANGLIAGVGIIATMVSLKLGGELADAGVSAQKAFRLDAATFALSAVLLLLMRLPRGSAARDDVQASPTTFRATAAGLRAGFRYVRQHRSVFEMLLIAGIVWFLWRLLRLGGPWFDL